MGCVIFYLVLFINLKFQHFLLSTGKESYFIEANICKLGSTLHMCNIATAYHLCYWVPIFLSDLSENTVEAEELSVLQELQ